jgi:hypothetical protein
VHTGRGTHNAIAFLDDDYLELLSIRDKAEYLAHSVFGGLVDLLEKGGGLRYIIVQSDDLAADVAAMRARGVDISDPAEGSRHTTSGVELRWKAAMLGERNPLPLFFIEHVTPVADRRRASPGAGDHPTGVQRVDRVYIAVTDVAAAAKAYSQVLGLPMPKVERGTVIMADMAVFNLGTSGLTVAQPAAPGPAADALAKNGPGPFQVLYRTRSMNAAANWMEKNGVPPPARGIRNNGEQAMLVPPAQASGVYIGFVGPA